MSFTALGLYSVNAAVFQLLSHLLRLVHLCRHGRDLLNPSRLGSSALVDPDSQNQFFSGQEFRGLITKGT